MTTAPNTLTRPTHPLRTATLLLATITTGLTAGVYTDWSNTIMPGLSEVDDRTFVAAFQALDAAIMNPLFLGVEFTGSLLLIALALILHLRSGQRAVLVWLSVALAAYLVSVVITMGVNEPLNQELRSMTDLNSDADFTTARALLDEARWTAWNTIRALATLTAFASLAWSLLLHHRR
ncbi:anthrone oxygenase family protein [Glycomyces sp. NPDC046736]|uniref:anthrone oxygenase family protein n=1 Tax=Glycomyces sp. NPDC046736 TaxID=3155615 RepID=UPI0033E52C9B